MTYISGRAIRLFIRLIGTLVPRTHRRRWIEEWLGELDAASRYIARRRLHLVLGALPDAIACRRLHGGGRRRLGVLHRFATVQSDLVYGVRQATGAPSHTIAIIASLAIGMTALTATFSGINAVLFRSLPGIGNQERLVYVFAERQLGSQPWAGPVALDEYRHFAAALTTMSGLAAYRSTSAAVVRGEAPAEMRAEAVSGNYFEVLQTTPAAGRLIRTSDATEPVAVASWSFAQRVFGSAAAAIGQTLRVNGRMLEVVGVAPPRFVGVNPGDVGESEADRTQLWFPLDIAEWLEGPSRSLVVVSNGLGDFRSTQTVNVVGRIRDDATVHDAVSQAAAVEPAPATRARPAIRRPGLGPSESGWETALGATLVMVVPALVLAIGCANAAILLLARASARQTEIAVRLALGATRARVVRQLVVESVIPAVVAAVVGLAGAEALRRLLASFLPIPVPLDWRVGVFAFAAALGTAVGFGLVPSLAATRQDIVSPLKNGSSSVGRPGSRLRTVLVVAQVALSLCLLVLGSLFARQLQRVDALEPERELRQVAFASVDLGLLRYPPAAAKAVRDSLLSRAREIDGVTAAAIWPTAPFQSGVVRYRLPHEPATAEHFTSGGGGDGDFLAAAGIPVVRGRPFTTDDRAGEPRAAIVSEALALRLGIDGDTLGSRVLVGTASGDRWLDVQIVGVARNIRQTLVPSLDDADAIYLPSPLEPPLRFTVWARTTGAADALVAQLRHIIGQIDADLPIRRSGIAGEAGRFAPVRWIAWTLTLVGTLALGLAAGGLYSVMTYLVAQRQHELGVRLALGARPTDLVGLVLLEALRLCTLGLAIGLLLAFLVGMTVKSILVVGSVFDLRAFGGVAIAFVVVALLAAAAPTLRAARLDPLETLRSR